LEIAGDSDGAAELVRDEVQNIVDEAEAVLASTAGADAIRAQHLLEQALHRTRAIRRTQRQRLGIEGQTAAIARRIREVGALSLATFHAFESERIDLSTAVDEARRLVRGKSFEEAALALAIIGPLTRIDEEKKLAGESLAAHPIHLLTSRLLMSSDGRIVHRSPGHGGKPVYGVDPDLWEEMMRRYLIRIDLYTVGLIGPAWSEMTLEHNPTVGDFAHIAAATGIVPRDRVFQMARALYYGWNGDFSSAAQLLAPQIENLVRRHLVDAGVTTSRIRPEDQTEHELGLSNLLDLPEAVEVIPADLVHELRALFASPTGPNLRNEIAHGLLSDGAAAAQPSMYAWWLALRMVYVPYWNAIHDVEAAEAREPRERADGS
jgi:ElaB/YqjD/DUF883 family membrane-anchored ribosome-binding protein